MGLVNHPAKKQLPSLSWHSPPKRGDVDRVGPARPGPTTKAGWLRSRAYGGDERDLFRRTAAKDPVCRGLQGDNKRQTMSVEAFRERPADGGAIPPASTIFACGVESSRRNPHSESRTAKDESRFLIGNGRLRISGFGRRATGFRVSSVSVVTRASSATAGRAASRATAWVFYEVSPSGNDCHQGALNIINET